MGHFEQERHKRIAGAPEPRAMRRILVALKRVVDYNVRIRVKPDGTGVVTDGVKLSINPFDESAIEEALRIRERGQADEVVAATIGTAECQPQLRTAIALGANRALHVMTDEPLEPLYGARLLHELAQREAPLLIMLGKQAIDDDNGQTGQMVAALWLKISSGWCPWAARSGVLSSVSFTDSP